MTHPPHKSESTGHTDFSPELDIMIFRNASHGMGHFCPHKKVYYEPGSRNFPEPSRIVPNRPESSRIVPNRPESTRIVPNRPDRKKTISSKLVCPKWGQPKISYWHTYLNYTYHPAHADKSEGAIRDDSRRFGTIRVDSGRFGTIRVHSGRFGTIRDEPGRFGTIRDFSEFLYFSKKSDSSEFSEF